MAERPARYESRDWNSRVISRYAVGLVIVCVAAAVAIHFFEKGLDRFFGYRGTATWTSSPTSVAPAPRLQSNSTQELAAMRAEEDVILHSYGWVDRPHGVTRIPVDVAMQLLVKRGVPVRNSATQPATPKPAP
jgi:hypothetical protein